MRIELLAAVTAATTTTSNTTNNNNEFGSNCLRIFIHWRGTFFIQRKFRSNLNSCYTPLLHWEAEKRPIDCCTAVLWLKGKYKLILFAHFFSSFSAVAAVAAVAAILTLLLLFRCAAKY